MDATRLESLYAAHAKKVLAYAQRRLTPEDAQEVVAETFLTAWRRLDTVPEDALPWLLTVARNIVLNQRRAASRRAALMLRLQRVLGQRGHVDPTGSDREVLRETVFAAIGTLSEREREALILIYWDDLDLVTAANVVGCSPGALSARLYRARRHLAMELTRARAALAIESQIELRRYKEASES